MASSVEKGNTQDSGPLPGLLPPAVTKEARDDETSETEVDGKLPRPVTATHSLLKWNKPKINQWRFLETLLAFLMMGANDSAFGV